LTVESTKVLSVKAQYNPFVLFRFQEQVQQEKQGRLQACFKTVAPLFEKVDESI